MILSGHFLFFILSFFQSRAWRIKVAYPLVVIAFLVLWYRSLLDKVGCSVYPSDQRLKDVDAGMVALVRLSAGKLFTRWRNNKVLCNYSSELREIEKAYRKKQWYLCVAGLFPILDYVGRSLLQTTNLVKGVGHLNKIFSDAGITLEELRPGYGAWDYARKTRADPKTASNTDLRLIGIAVESFLKFSAVYYKHCTNESSVNQLNRHAVMHGATNGICTKENATKMLLFLDLMVNLLPAFEILLRPADLSNVAG
jgi:hypothetical protein